MLIQVASSLNLLLIFFLLILFIYFTFIDTESLLRVLDGTNRAYLCLFCLNIKSIWHIFARLNGFTLGQGLPQIHSRFLGSLFLPCYFLQSIVEEEFKYTMTEGGRAPFYRQKWKWRRFCPQREEASCYPSCFLPLVPKLTASNSRAITFCSAHTHTH